MYAEAPAGLPAPSGAYGRLAEASAGKDSTTGHWELMGLTVPVAFPLYPEGFPPEVVEPFEKAVGKKVLYNRPASGTEIIKQYGEEHMKTGRPIVYTSGDSVFQIAAHEEVVPIDELYRWSEIARGILVGKHRVGRVIARPFVGAPGSFTRTHRRHDFTVPPGRPDAPRRAPGPGQARLRDRKDRGPLLGTRRRPGRPHGIQPRRAREDGRGPLGARRRLRLHEPQRLRHEVRPPQRPGGLRPGARGTGLVRPGPPRGPRATATS